MSRPGLTLFLAVNIIAFLFMGIDKWKAARGTWRISEARLFLFPLLGGALGGTLGMLLFHHKTRHWYFAWGFPLLAVVQLMALIYLQKSAL